MFWRRSIFILCLTWGIASSVQAKTNPLENVALYVEPNSNAQQQVEEWQESRPEDAALIQLIAEQPQGKWLGEWNTAPKQEVEEYVEAAENEGTVPLLVLYHIPFRDCGQYSAGGAVNAAEYRKFVNKVVAGIGQRQVVMIVEPDALAGAGCLTQKQRTKRYELVSYAVTQLKTQTQAVVYIDAGNANWISAQKIANRLRRSGIEMADGFSLNVSNYYTTKRTRRFGEDVSAKVSGKHFVIDTSRNGQGPADDYEWCNPSGRGLGHVPTTTLAHPLIDALLWVKAPGESDGECNGGPAAGEWWPEYALGLARRADLN